MIVAITTAGTVGGPIAAGDNDNAVALTHADGSHGEAVEPTLLGLNAEGWVYVGILIFLLLAVFLAKAPQRIAAMLDQRIADTRRQLDEATAIRAEAEALLAEARTRHQASAGDAEAIIRHAEQEAQALLVKAQGDAAELVSRRSAMAEDKIAAAERQALADVRARTVDAATRAAGTIIARGHDANADRTLVDRAIGGLSRPH